ncbi:MAG: glucoamylase family protein [Candidatus Acidiferrum sp.]|jgi:hypothetical protein
MTQKKNDLLPGFARPPHPLSRRNWLRDALFAGTALALPRYPLFARALPQWPTNAPPPTPAASPLTINPPPSSTTSAATRYRFTPKEDAFLEEIERTTFQFFWDSADPTTGLIKDRSLARQQDARNVASIAATGFGLTAVCIAAERQWQPRDAILSRVLTTLHFAAEKLPHEHGFFYHFLKMDTGERIFKSEVSTIDTAIFLCGALTCRAYFSHNEEVNKLVTSLYDRADFAWFLHDAPDQAQTLSMGWTPETGYIKTRWAHYSELMMLYLLAMGANTRALPASAWDAWIRPHFEFNGIRYIGSFAPIFVHQYSHAWFDFRGRHDKYADYFTNSAIATEVHKIWCLEMSRQFPDYTEDLWGITASDSQKGYTGWGGPPLIGHPDGSVVPCASAGSLPFLPQETLRVLETIRDKYAQNAWTTYGFVDAFNPLTNWASPDVIGIDAGITIVMAENARTGFVWEHFMSNPEIRRAMDKAQFQKNA